MSNPLTQVQFNVPFDRIRAEHVVPAIDLLLEEAQVALDTLVADESPPIYGNTLAALEDLV